MSLLRKSKFMFFLIVAVFTLVAHWSANPARAADAPGVNLLAIGDMAGDTPERAAVTKAVTESIAASGKHFDAAIVLGDVFNMKLTGPDDLHIQRLFEKAYDPQVLNFPFYIAYGNHDYEYGKAPIEWEYSRQHPESRFKLPAPYYRINLPDKNPLVTMLVLDSNQQALDETRWQEEIDWIDAELSKPRGAWTICCAHHPFFSNGAHGDNGVLQTQWGELFKKHHVDFYISGHDHTMQHLEVPGWPISFVISGGGGGGRRQMLRDNRGPFSRSTLGFATFQFQPDVATVWLFDENKNLMHSFTRTRAGHVEVEQNTPSDKATTRPLRTIVGLPDWGPRPTTQPSKGK